jgi:hypothetical protein
MHTSVVDADTFCYNFHKNQFSCLKAVTMKLVGEYYEIDPFSLANRAASGVFWKTLDQYRLDNACLSHDINFSLFCYASAFHTIGYLGSHFPLIKLNYSCYIYERRDLYLSCSILPYKWLQFTSYKYFSGEDPISNMNVWKNIISQKMFNPD